MRCPIESGESGELFLAYSARKLDGETSAALAQHLQTCAACRKLADDQQVVSAALDSWVAQPVAAAEFDRRLYQRIEREVSWWDRMMRPFRPILSRQGLPAAAAAGLLIFAGVLLERPAGVPIVRPPTTALIDVVAPDQADHALEDMELMREFNGLVHPDTAEPSKL
jgi:Putative zinc-finger